MKSRTVAALLTLSWLVGCLSLHGCAGRSASAPNVSGSPLLGRWVVRPVGAPCDFELELLPGGAARSNYLNDDSPQQLCAIHRLSYSSGTPMPDSLDFWLGSQVVRHCFYQLSGPNLALVCDEHGPPSRATPPLLFSRAAAPVASSAGSVIGKWQSGGMALEFTQDGRMLAGGSAIGYRLLSASELELLYARPELCSYELHGDNELLLGCASMGGGARPLVLRR